MKTISYKEQTLSKLSFGTVQLGLDYGVSNTQGKPTQDIADNILNYLVHEGINCFDTAVAYGNSEEVLGSALKDNKDVNIVSKVKTNLFLENLEKSVLESLARLNVDKLFALLLHDSDLLFKWNNSFGKQINSLKKRKLINCFGVSIYTSEEFDMAIDNPSIEVIQIPFNLFDQRAINHQWFERAKKAKKLIFIRSVFLQGLFFLKEQQLSGNIREALPFIQEVHDLRKELKLSIAEFALSYVDSTSPESIILFGCDTLEQAHENINSYNDLPKLDENMLKKINTLFSKVPEYITNPSRWRI